MKKLIISLALLAASAGAAQAENYVCHVNHSAEQAIIVDNQADFIVYNMDFEPVYRSAELHYTKGQMVYRVGERDGLAFRANTVNGAMFDIKDSASGQEFLFHSCSVIPEEKQAQEDTTAGATADMVGQIADNDNAGSFTGDIWNDEGKVISKVKMVRDGNKKLTVTFEDDSVMEFTENQDMDSKAGTYFIARNHLELYLGTETIVIGNTAKTK
ncbi:hypothetical protein GTB64_004534 [Salmonella enterica]|nr:hypothetical protein [Salmonella enterica]